MDRTLILLLTLLAAGFLAWHAAALWGAIRSGGWPQVPGRVLQAAAEESGVASGDVPWSRPLYVARVRYEYEVGGRTYRNDRLRFGGPGLTSRTDAQAALAALLPGAPVRVAYDPRDPYNAVLRPGADAAHYVWTLTCAVLVLVGLGVYHGVLPGAG